MPYCKHHIDYRLQTQDVLFWLTVLKHLGALLTLVFLEFVKLNSLKEVIISRCCRIYLILLTPPVRFNTLVIYIAYCDYHFKNIIAIKKWKKNAFLTLNLPQNYNNNQLTIRFLLNSFRLLSSEMYAWPHISTTKYDVFFFIFRKY